MIGQSKLASMVEQATATAVKFVVSMLLMEIVATVFLGISLPATDNLFITGLFTVNSIVLGYGFRRLFNRIHVRKYEQEKTTPLG